LLSDLATSVQPTGTDVNEKNEWSKNRAINTNTSRRRTMPRAPVALCPIPSVSLATAPGAFVGPQLGKRVAAGNQSIARILGMLKLEQTARIRQL
jgi:hypothetical protein